MNLSIVLEWLHESPAVLKFPTSSRVINLRRFISYNGHQINLALMFLWAQ